MRDLRTEAGEKYIIYRDQQQAAITKENNSDYIHKVKTPEKFKPETECPPGSGNSLGTSPVYFYVIILILAMLYKYRSTKLPVIGFGICLGLTTGCMPMPPSAALHGSLVRMDENIFLVKLVNVSEKDIFLSADQDNLLGYMRLSYDEQVDDSDFRLLATSDPEWSGSALSPEQNLKPFEIYEFKIILGDNYRVAYSEGKTYLLDQFSSNDLLDMLRKMKAADFNIMYLSDDRQINWLRLHNDD